MGFWDAVASAGPYANNLHLAPDNHTNISSLNFLQARRCSWGPTNSVKALDSNCLTTCEDWTNKRFICLVHAYSLSIVSQRLPLNATLAIFAFTAFKLLNALQADSDYNSNSSRYWRQIISLFIYLFIISLFKFKRVTKRFGRQINQFSEIVWKSRR